VIRGAPPQCLTLHEGKYETISRELKVYLTRILPEKISDPDNSEMSLIRKNRIVNMSLNIQN